MRQIGEVLFLRFLPSKNSYAISAASIMVRRLVDRPMGFDTADSAEMTLASFRFQSDGVVLCHNWNSTRIIHSKAL